MDAKQAEAFAKLREGWIADGPARFAVEALGADPTEQQWEASRKLVLTRRVSIRSGHGTGKSTFMAWCVLWFLACYFPAKVPATAPTGHQLSDVLWAEIAKWHRILGDHLPWLAAQYDWNSDAYRLKDAPNEAFAVARTSRPERPEALQGFHSDNILFLIDEASGVADNVFEVAEGALSTEGAFVVMAANPTRQSGYFFDSHHKMRSAWAALHWNGEDSPRVSRQYIANMAKKYGTSSPIYKVRVQGNFVMAADGVINLELCELAKIREVERNTAAPIVWGLDVARFGDDSCALAGRQGNHQLVMGDSEAEAVKEWFGANTMQTVGIVKARWDRTPPAERPAAINVDVIGIGAGVVDRLDEMGLPVVGVNVAESESVNANPDVQFSRLRDELWWKGREWLERRDCRMCDDDETIGELTTPTYKILSNGRIQVERKDELKARGVKSPNRADAWLLTFHEGGHPGKWKAEIKYPSLGYR